MRVMVTGATRGLGAATARALADRGAAVTVTGRSPSAVQEVAEQVGGTAALLDVSRPAGVGAAVGALPPQDVLVCNAGVQTAGAAPVLTADGVEVTLATNVLGHVALIDALLASAVPPTAVVLIGSATHDPAVRTGLPAPVESLDVAALARGEAAAGGLQRYSTSKLHVTALAAAYARERPDVRWTCFDPGLMPGTGLARARGPLARLAWRTAARALTVLPGASTPARSAAALAAVVLDAPADTGDGSAVDHRLRPAARSARARDAAYQDALLGAVRTEVRRLAGSGG